MATRADWLLVVDLSDRRIDAKRHVTDLGVAWPAGLRVKPVQGARGVWEMTWSLAGPDGRATFEWVQIGGERAIRWRRVGGHAIVSDP